MKLGVEAVGGAIPLAGYVFDFVWKANQRNLALMDRHAADSARAGKSDRFFLVLLAALIIVVCAGIAVGGLVLASKLLRAILGT